MSSSERSANGINWKRVIVIGALVGSSHLFYDNHKADRGVSLKPIGIDEGMNYIGYIRDAADANGDDLWTIDFGISTSPSTGYGLSPGIGKLLSDEVIIAGEYANDMKNSVKSMSSKDDLAELFAISVIAKKMNGSFKTLASVSPDGQLSLVRIKDGANDRKPVLIQTQPIDESSFGLYFYVVEEANGILGRFNSPIVIADQSSVNDESLSDIFNRNLVRNYSKIGNYK